MKCTISQELSDKIDKLVIDGVKDLNIFIPDSSIYSLSEYVKKKVKWSVLFNARQTLIDYIDKNNLLYTEIGDILYHMIDYNDVFNTKNKKPLPILTLNTILVVPEDNSSLDVCHPYHNINVNKYSGDVTQTRIADIESTLNMTCSNILYELFSNEFDFILRKGIYDLSIDVVEDIQEDAYPDHDDM